MPCRCQWRLTGCNINDTNAGLLRLNTDNIEAVGHPSDLLRLLSLLVFNYATTGELRKPAEIRGVRGRILVKPSKESR